MDFIEEINIEQKKINKLGNKIKYILTHGDKIPFEDAYNALSPYQKAVVDTVLLGSASITDDYSNNNHEYIIHLGISPLGQIHMKDPDNFDQSNNIVFTSLFFCKSEIEFISQRKSYYEKLENPLVKEAIDFWEKCSDEQKLDILNFVEHIIYHMAPVIFFYDDTYYTSFDKYNNLLFQNGKKEPRFYHIYKLKEKKIKQWGVQEKVFFYSLYCLLKSGPPSRGEELSGMQLRPIHVKDHFTSLLNTYAKALGVILNFDGKETLLEQAEYVDSIRKKVLSNSIIWRNIKGITLNKREQVTPKVLSTSSDKFKFIPDRLGSFFLSHYNKRIKEFNHLNKDFYALIENIFHHHPKEATKEIEKIIHTIVLLATNNLKSDFGMTRGIRDFSKFIQLHKQNEIHAICSLPSSHYFCCVSPNECLPKNSTDKDSTLIKTLCAISARMTYNSWHYMAGNFPFSEIPKERHFYFPPLMSDITSLSEYRHRGHIVNHVVNCIRCPQSIEIMGKEYYAFCDFRVMRQNNMPYTLHDLNIAHMYSIIIKNLYQATIEYVIHTDAYIEITAFSNRWYKEKYKIKNDGKDS